MILNVTIEYRTVWGEELKLRSGRFCYPMEYSDGGKWTASVDTSEWAVGEYHYEVVKDGLLIRREWGSHHLDMLCDGKGSSNYSGTVLDIIDWWQDVPQRLPERCRIFREGTGRKSGTAIPVFSLRSGDDFGTGEFLDLKKLADWAASTGQSVIQILPVNDTTMTRTWKDSYPYNANSSFALHPIYINLPAAGVAADNEYRKMQQELNSLAEVDYERVVREKERLLRQAFAETFSETEALDEYTDFISGNRDWLIPYAVYCVLRDMHGTSDFSQWGEYSVYSSRMAEEFIHKEKEAVDFHCFVQFHLNRQLCEASRYARSKGVILKGDIPIGISRTSVDAWLHPELFNLDSCTGAPPDAFSADGQNWGFPTYNWDRMEEDGFKWWKARLKKMSEYFDAFRIDHILGFFRIWEIPAGSPGTLGHFSPALPYSTEELKAAGFSPRRPRKGSDNVLFVEDSRRHGFWHPRISAYLTGAYKALDSGMKKKYDDLYEDFFYHRHNGFWKSAALKKLPELLASTRMTACGEDLGMIPACVPETMEELQILSLEVQRMPKAFGQTFGDTSSYPRLSVCTTSTHDMSPLRAWWKEDRKLTQKYYNEVLGYPGTAPDVCEPPVCRKIIEMHISSPSMLAILPLQDWLSMDGRIRCTDPDRERINVPSDPEHRWCYRMHISIEELCSCTGFNSTLRWMNEHYGRV